MTRVRVGIRARPLTQQEKESGDEIVVGITGNSVVLKKQVKRENGRECDVKDRRFSYDYCFWSVDKQHPEFASQQTIYDAVGVPVVKSLLDGYNACVFAYGQSGSGKSYTVTGHKADVGLLPRLCEDIYSKIELRQKHYKAELNLSYVEIYKERAHDLLRTSPEGALENLRVREHPLFGPFLDGLTRHKVSGVQDIISLVENAKNVWNSIQPSTGDQVKRSHSIFTLNCTQTSGKTGRKLISELHLVDLAGSETVPLDGCFKDHQDITNINKSLVTLGIVISSLANKSNCSRGNYVPFRNSILTWLLKETLGGNCITFMIATISPSSKNYKNTLSTLRYAERAGNILNLPIVNEASRSELQFVTSLKGEINLLPHIKRSGNMAKGIGLDKAAMHLITLVSSLDSLDSLNDVPEIPSRTMSSSWEQLCDRLAVRRVYKSRSLGGERMHLKANKIKTRTYSLDCCLKKLISCPKSSKRIDENIIQMIMSCAKSDTRGSTSESVEKCSAIDKRTTNTTLKDGNKAILWERPVNTFYGEALKPKKKIPESNDKMIKSLVLNTAKVETLSSFSSEKLLPPQSLFFQLRKIPSKNSLNCLSSQDKPEFIKDTQIKNEFDDFDLQMVDSLESPGNDSGFKEISESNFSYECYQNLESEEDCKVTQVNGQITHMDDERVLADKPKSNEVACDHNFEDADVNKLAEELKQLHVSDVAESDKKSNEIQNKKRIDSTFEMTAHHQARNNFQSKDKKQKSDKELRDHNAQRFRRRRSSYSTDSVEGYNNVTSCESLCVEVFKPQQTADLKSLAFMTHNTPKNFSVVEEQKVPFTLRDPGTPDSGFVSSRAFPSLRNAVWPNGCQLNGKADYMEDQFRDAESTSSSASSDSITYVFLDRRMSNAYQQSFRLSEEKSSGSEENEPPSVIDLLRCNSKHSNANSTVTLDSLEVCPKDERFQKECRSPRALSIDSFAAEEYFKMVGPHNSINKQVVKPTYNLVSKQCFTTKTNVFSKTDYDVKSQKAKDQREIIEPNVFSELEPEASESINTKSCTTSSESSATSVVLPSKILCASPKPKMDMNGPTPSKETIHQKHVDADLVKLMSDVVGLLTTLQKQNIPQNKDPTFTESMTDQTVSAKCICHSQNSSSSSSSNERFQQPFVQTGEVGEHRKTIRRSLRDEIRLLRKERDHVMNLLRKQERSKLRLRFENTDLSTQNTSYKFVSRCSADCSPLNTESFSDSQKFGRDTGLKISNKNEVRCSKSSYCQDSCRNCVNSVHSNHVGSNLSNRFHSRQIFTTRVSPQNSISNDVFSSSRCPHGRPLGRDQLDHCSSCRNNSGQRDVQTKGCQSHSEKDTSVLANKTIPDVRFLGRDATTSLGMRRTSCSGKFTDRAKENKDAKTMILASDSKRAVPPGFLRKSTTQQISRAKMPTGTISRRMDFDELFGPDIFKELPNHFSKKSLEIPIFDPEIFYV